MVETTKRLMLSIVFIILSNIVYSQVYISVSEDFRNRYFGSEPTGGKEKFDILFTMGFIGQYDVICNPKAGVIYESFTSIDYQKYGIDVGTRIELVKCFYSDTFIGRVTKNMYLDLSIAGIQIIRINDEFVSAQLNANLVYKLNDRIGLILSSSFESAQDLNAKYGGDNFRKSVYIGIIIQGKKWNDIERRF